MGSRRITGNERYPRNVRDVFPSQYASSTQHPMLAGEPDGAPEDSEPHAIKCAQCGLPIEDYTVLDTCPSCGSDNFLGRIY